MSYSLDTPTITYRIDADDRLVSVNDAFLSFARKNAGEELTLEALLHQPLWKYIADEESRLLYRFILGRVRSGQPIALQLRCDSPVCRREIELEMCRLPPNQVHFDSRTLDEQARAYVALLDSTVPRTFSVISICSWCKKVQVPGHGWFEAEDATELLQLVDVAEQPRLAHIVCFDCYRKVLTYR